MSGFDIDLSPQSDPYVACALCGKQEPGRSVPQGWGWLPDARLACEKCLYSPRADVIRMNDKKGRQRRVRSARR